MEEHNPGQRFLPLSVGVRAVGPSQKIPAQPSRRSSSNGQWHEYSIFGTSKSFDTKKAERWFKERRIKFQSVDLKRYGMSRGELASVRQAMGLEAMIDPKHPDAVTISYLASEQAKLDHLFEDPSLLNTPIVRNGKQATVGYCPQIWETWS